MASLVLGRQKLPHQARMLVLLHVILVNLHIDYSELRHEPVYSPDNGQAASQDAHVSQGFALSSSARPDCQ